MKEKIVKYRDYEDEKGDIKYVVRSKKVVVDGYKTYSNCMHKLSRLSNCASLLLHFICQEMDGDNSIVHTSKLRKKFILLVKNTCDGLEYKDNTVKLAFYSLVNEDLIIPFDERSTFVVSPYHFFKGTEAERIKVINELLRFAVRSRGKMKKNNIYRVMGISEEILDKKSPTNVSVGESVKQPYQLSSDSSRR